MSLELKIEELTAAVTALTLKLQSLNHVVAEPAPVVKPVMESIAPVRAPQPQPQAMPAPPVLSSQVVAVSPSTVAPFTDHRGLVEYTMSVYKQLGSDKGSLIQGVMTGLGYSNINDIKPEHFADFFAGLEELKS